MGEGGWVRLLELPITYEEAKYSLKRLGGVFKCPLLVGVLHVNADGNGSELLFQRFFSYGYNAWGVGSWDEHLGLGGARAPLRPGAYRQTATTASMVRAPSNLKAFGDSFHRSRNASFDSLIKDDGTIAPKTTWTSSTGYNWKMPLKKQPSFLNHRARANRVFADGHLESEDMRRVFSASDFELRRWNVNNEPHRDRLQD